MRLSRTLPIDPSSDISLLKRVLYEVREENFRDAVYFQWSNEERSDDSAWKNLLNFPSCWSPPIFPLSGSDALILGFKGKSVGQSLKKVEDWWIENEFSPSKEECLLELSKISTINN